MRARTSGVRAKRVVLEEVRRADGAAQLRDEAGHARAPREDDALAPRGARVAGDRHRHHVAGARLEAVETGGVGADQSADAIGDLLRHGHRIEGLREHLAQPRERLGLPATGLRLGEQARIPHRERGLRREGDQERPAVLAEPLADGGGSG